MNSTPDRTRSTSPERLALGLAGGVVVVAAGLAVIATLFMASVQRSITPGSEILTTAVAAPLPPPGPRLDSAAVTRGRDHFAVTCALCHGEDGLGRPGLGKNLALSNFIAQCSDGYIAGFLEKGRAADDPLNTTRIPMPPKGGNPDLTGQDLADIVTYLRALQDPRRVETGLSLLARVEEPEEAETGTAASPAATAASAAAVAISDSASSDAADDEDSGDDSLAEDDWYDAETIALGAKMYKASCVSCHGADARGLKNLGKDLVSSKFIMDADDDQMIDFLKKGRPASDPANTTKIDMPPKGGNPSLNEEKMEAIVAYIRDLQRKAQTTKS